MNTKYTYVQINSADYRWSTYNDLPFQQDIGTLELKYGHNILILGGQTLKCFGNDSYFCQYILQKQI